MRLEELGLIGNCQFSALIHRDGNIVWCCLPRFDSPPVLSTLLDERRGGSFRVCAASEVLGVQRYLPNTNVFETRFEDQDGAFRVLDFAPRFLLHGRFFRPTQLYRVVEPLSGTPRVRVHISPRLGWSQQHATAIVGSNHLDFPGFASPLRLTTDVPLSYLNGTAFSLTERRHLGLTWGEPIEEPLAPLCDRFLTETLRYWQRWVKHCNIPTRFQEEVIRSALVLKLHCFEDTGAIIAAMTTSIPESPNSGRTWDYRYCWLRDAYYTIDSLRLLGHFDEREHFIEYLLNLASSAPDLHLAPLYRVDGGSDLEEQELPDWPGYEGHGPVRIGNGAALHQQNDIFGELVLALAPALVDRRFEAEHSAAAQELVERLARHAISLAGTRDAGIWEFRTEWVPQTFSSLMSWAAADRMARVSAHQGRATEGFFRDAASRIHAEISARAWNPTRNAFVGAYDGAQLDASLLQMATLRFVPRDSPRLIATVDTIGRELRHGDLLQRYDLDDGFGKPSVAFSICAFWYVEALAAIGRVEEARERLDRLVGIASPTGLLSEDYDMEARRMWGNIPQAYPHAGLIQAAFATSPSWREIV